MDWKPDEETRNASMLQRLDFNVYKSIRDNAVGGATPAAEQVAWRRMFQKVDFIEAFIRMELKAKGGNGTSTSAPTVAADAKRKRGGLKGFRTGMQAQPVDGGIRRGVEVSEAAVSEHGAGTAASTAEEAAAAKAAAAASAAEEAAVAAFSLAYAGDGDMDGQESSSRPLSGEEELAEELFSRLSGSLGHAAVITFGQGRDDDGVDGSPQMVYGFLREGRPHCQQRVDDSEGRDSSRAHEGGHPLWQSPFHERDAGSAWYVARKFRDGDVDGEESDEYMNVGTSALRGLTGSDNTEDTMYYWALRLFVAKLDSKFMLKGTKEKKDLLTIRPQNAGEDGLTYLKACQRREMMVHAGKDDVSKEILRQFIEECVENLRINQGVQDDRAGPDALAVPATEASDLEELGGDRRQQCC
ncbi:hypothetical protein CYMTET_27165 [Cymbomonas tetramitiformis]|uniref:Uncharacterized protein n=1 Tax=Cymbomonas tetramitiformis TaxID=36881 RepID=A0AAE0FQL8_9CHLO|nr:hypothetical protein CYMTET_27165 [Cymbomonas tetramitiformis]